MFIGLLIPNLGFGQIFLILNLSQCLCFGNLYTLHIDLDGLHLDLVLDLSHCQVCFWLQFLTFFLIVIVCVVDIICNLTYGFCIFADLSINLYVTFLSESLKLDWDFISQFLELECLGVSKLLELSLRLHLNELSITLPLLTVICLHVFEEQVILDVDINNFEGL